MKPLTCVNTGIITPNILTLVHMHTPAHTYKHTHTHTHTYYLAHVHIHCKLTCYYVMVLRKPSLKVREQLTFTVNFITLWILEDKERKFESNYRL